MTQLTIIPVVEALDDKVWTTSYEVARVFGKAHFNVMRDIRNILKQKPQLRGINFEVTFENKYIGNVTKKTPFYRIDKDGFALLAFGFTGDKALDFKLAYIDAFNKMQKAIADSKLVGLHEFLRISAKYERARAVASDAGKTLQAWKGAKTPLEEKMKLIADNSQLELPFV